MFNKDDAAAGLAFENAVQNDLVEKGYRVLRAGWPDFLAIRGKSVVFVECKFAQARLSKRQAEMHAALAGLGFTVETRRPDGSMRVAQPQKLKYRPRKRRLYGRADRVARAAAVINRDAAG
jgi:hypothetical protein